MRLPKEAPAPMTEHQEQCALIQWWQWQCSGYGIPEPLLYAIPNGGARHIVVAKKLKDEGVRAGIPDLFLAVSRNGFHGLYIELKTASGRPSSAQKAIIGELEQQGYACKVCHGFEEARRAIADYLGKDE
ncbi:MAG: VRR-NUC domain-containing protein [Desulfovibrionaceae bacterium]|nr:VRR-NUC domain-containing protein [Desulfovibrionaceae bacterium]